MTFRIGTCLFLTAVLASAGASGWAFAIQDLVERRVTIAAGEVTLGASLYRSASAHGDLPLVVTAHGSAPSDREGVLFYTYRAMDLGFAALSFDKRGTGESTGEYVSFSVEGSIAQFDDLASDLAHAIEFGAQQEGINSRCVGLFGGSQAGWIMPLAASRSDLVDFIIVGEGAVTTAGQEEIHGQILQARRGYESNPEITAQDIAMADNMLEAYIGEPGYDPLPVLEALDIPILWIFGLQDAVIPVTPALNRLQNLIAAGHDNHHLLVFPFGDHNFTNRATGERYDLVGPIRHWLTENGICG